MHPLQAAAVVVRRERETLAELFNSNYMNKPHKPFVIVSYKVDGRVKSDN